jgi:hypothetical protein
MGNGMANPEQHFLVVDDFETVDLREKLTQFDF